MLRWNKYKHLHVVRNLRNLIGRLWNSDVFFLDEKGTFSNPLNEQYFHNKYVSHLFKNDHMKQGLAEYLHHKTAESKEATILKWEAAGLSVLAVPVFADRVWAGLVGVTGFVTQPEQTGPVQNMMSKENVENFPIECLGKEKMRYMEEILTSLAQEIVIAYQMEKENRTRQKGFKEDSSISYEGLIGESSVMKNLYVFLDKIKSTDSNILIQGENGTGKELVAQAIYKNSPRKKEPFIAQNCSAFSDSLLESELFGHVKGSFTGAVQDKRGLFEMADKGTFFLDEIGDTSLSMQAKLLRVLQDGTFFPVGSVKQKKMDVRIIAATNRDLRAMISKKTFREDLYYRLNVINIKIPPLRERKDDIEILAEYFMHQFSTSGAKDFDAEVMNYLKTYPWPGNVRELQNEIQRMVILSQSDNLIAKEVLSDKILHREASIETLSQTDGLKLAVKKLERKMIGRCLQNENWNKTKAAKKLGISRAALISKVKIYDLERKSS